MATVTGYTAAKMEEVKNRCITDAVVVGGELILQREGGTDPINVGDVMGPPGPEGPAGGIDETALNAGSASLIESALYVPTLLNWSVGSGGASNNAVYTFVGGPDSGDDGLLIMNGRMVFGSSGRSSPAGTDEMISLPTGFTARTIANHGGSFQYLFVGRYWTSIGANETGDLILTNNDATRMRLIAPDGTAVATDFIDWTAQLPARRT